MIEKLEPWQEALIPHWQKLLLEAGQSTQPANRKEAEAGVAAAYRAIGKEPPKVILWARSPQEGCILSLLVSQLGTILKEQAEQDPVGDLAPISDQASNQLDKVLDHAPKRLSTDWRLLRNALSTSWRLMHNATKEALAGDLGEDALGESVLDLLPRVVIADLLSQLRDWRNKYGSSIKLSTPLAQDLIRTRTLMQETLGEPLAHPLGDAINDWLNLMGLQLGRAVDEALHAGFAIAPGREEALEILLDQQGDSLRPQMRQEVWDQAVLQLKDQIGPMVDKILLEFWLTLPLDDTQQDLVEEQILGVGEPIAPVTWAKLADQRQLWGQITDDVKKKLIGIFTNDNALLNLMTDQIGESLADDLGQELRIDLVARMRDPSHLNSPLMSQLWEEIASDPSQSQDVLKAWSPLALLRDAPLVGKSIGEPLQGQMGETLWFQVVGALSKQLGEELREVLITSMGNPMREAHDLERERELVIQEQLSRDVDQIGESLHAPLQKGILHQFLEQLYPQFSYSRGRDSGFVGEENAPSFELFRQLVLDKGWLGEGTVGDSLEGQLGRSLWNSLAKPLIPQMSEGVEEHIRENLWMSLWRSENGAPRRRLVEGALTDPIGEPLSGKATKNLRDQLEQLRRQISNPVYDQLLSLFKGRRAGLQVWEKLQALTQDSEQLKNQIKNACFGQHDLYWLGYWQFVRKILGAEYTGTNPDGMLQVAFNSGWWWPYDGVCILSERPQEAHKDEDGRYHRRDGLAIRYPDGSGVATWHGTRIPNEWVLDPTTLTPEVALTHPNVEQRRAAAEMLGWAAIINHLQPLVVNQDPDPRIGTLLRVDLPDAPNSQFLRVLCGTGRTFVLPVPPEMLTALEANAWTYGLNPEDFKLEVRT